MTVSRDTPPLRCEWAKLGFSPRYPDCPLVRNIDTAHDAVRMAQEAGLISDAVADQRIGMLNLRRMAIVAAQEQYGCPQGTCDVEEGVAEGYDCLLPVGSIEFSAFGEPHEMDAMMASSKTVKMGFKP